MTATKTIPTEESPRQAAMRAIDEANLTEAGYQYLLGALAAAAPEEVHAALARLRNRESERYFRSTAS